MVKRVIIRIVSLLVLVFALLYIVSAVMNHVFYTPNNTSDFNVLGILVETISPYTQCTYQRKDLQLPHMFSFYRHHIFLQKIMNENGKNLHLEEHRSIDFFLGKIYAVSTLEHGDNQDVILKQSEFTASKSIEEWPQRLDNEQFYEALIAFQESQPLQTVIETYFDLFQTTQRCFRQENSSEDKSYQGGVIWIALKTSEDENSTCLGVNGPYSAHFFDRAPTMKTTEKDVDFLCSEYKQLFTETLELLAENEKETDMFLESFFNVDNIYFPDRLSYANKHSYPCLGFTVYLRGDALRTLLEDKSIKILDCYKKEVDGVESQDPALLE